LVNTGVTIHFFQTFGGKASPKPELALVLSAFECASVMTKEFLFRKRIFARFGIRHPY
jgi:hypothetical protein